MANPGRIRSYPMLDFDLFDAADADDMELGLNEADDLDGLILMDHDSDGDAIIRLL